MKKRRSGSFGGRADRKLRERILVHGMTAMPKSWQKQWMFQRIVATPPWADMKAIREKYYEAEKMTALMGMKYCVDHIIPLNHPRVCGLHVAWNLQVITEKRNAAKTNYFCPEQSDLFGFDPQLELI